MTAYSNRGSSIGILVPMFGLIVLAGVLGLILLGGAGAAPTATTVHHTSRGVVDWLSPGQVQIPSNMTISAHAEKHNGDAEKIYALILEGKCAAVAKYCGGSELERMYACVDPVTGLVGILLQFGDEVKTGYFARNSNNLRNRITRENWRACK